MLLTATKNNSELIDTHCHISASQVHPDSRQPGFHLKKKTEKKKEVGAETLPCFKEMMPHKSVMLHALPCHEK